MNERAHKLKKWFTRTDNETFHHNKNNSEVVRVKVNEYTITLSDKRDIIDKKCLSIVFILLPTTESRKCSERKPVMKVLATVKVIWISWKRLWYQLPMLKFTELWHYSLGMGEGGGVGDKLLMMVFLVILVQKSNAR